MSEKEQTPFARLKKTAFSKDGSRAYLTFELPDGSEVSFRILYEAYVSLIRGRDTFGSEDIAETEKEAEYSDALASAMNILSFGGNTRLELYRKLKIKRYKNEAAERAVDYVMAKGYIDERSLCKEEIERGIRKLWGEAKIRQKLVSRGFSGAVLSAAEKTLAKYDFGKSCLKLAMKKCETPPVGYEERQKLFSYLTRSGYSANVIRETILKITDEEDFGE